MSHGSYRVVYWDPCGSSNRVHLGASTSFGNCEGLDFLEIAWCVRSLTDLSPGASSTGDWYLDMWVRFQWSRVELSCYVYLARASVDGYIFVTKLDPPPQPWSRCDALALLLWPPLWPNWDASWGVPSLDRVEFFPHKMMITSHQSFHAYVYFE